MFKLFYKFGAAVVAIMVSTTSFAATLTEVQGDIKVNRGQGFKSVTSEIIVNPGDRVMAGPKGSAKIIYNNERVFIVTPGQILSVLTDQQAKKLPKPMAVNGNENLVEQCLFLGIDCNVATIIGAGAGLGGFIALIADDDDNPPPPAMPATP